MLKSLERYIRKHGLMHAGERIGVAVSGGADSVALLRALVGLGPNLGIVPFVLHLNHLFRGAASDGDAQFVSDLAAELGLECEVESQDVGSLAAMLHLSLEAAGRRARYAFFQRAAADLQLDAVATAHTRDDQAETVLLRLVRGAGTSGLAGIHRTMPLEALAPVPVLTEDTENEEAQVRQVRLVRPLLAISRQKVEEYLRSLGQTFRQDGSNVDPRFLRNRVRAELLPTLERDYNPAVREALCETAEIAAAENEYLEQQVAAFFAAVPEGAVTISKLQSQPLALQRRILRAICQSHGLALDFAHLEALREFALASRAGRQPLVRGFEAEVIRKKHSPASLVLRPPHSAAQPAGEYSLELPVPGRVAIDDRGMQISASLRGADPAELAYNRVTFVDRDRVGDFLTVRNLLPGDRIRTLHSSGERKVTRLLQDLAIPAAARRSWPVILAAGRIVWVPGLPVAAEFAWSPGQGEAVILEMCSGEDTAFHGETNHRKARGSDL